MGRLRSWFSSEYSVQGVASASDPGIAAPQYRRLAAAGGISLASSKQNRWGQYEFKPITARLVIEQSITKSGMFANSFLSFKCFQHFFSSC